MGKVNPSWSVYEKNAIIVWGTGVFGERMLSALQKLDIPVLACCDNAEENWGITFRGVPVISPEELSKYQERHQNLLIQLGVNYNYEEEIVKQLESFGIKQYMSFIEGMAFLFTPLRDKFLELYPALTEEILQSYQRALGSYSYHKRFPVLGLEEQGVIVMLPRKTGDGTIMSTCRKHGIPVTFGGHSPVKIALPQENSSPVKIISAVRDPIARDVSDIFEAISKETMFFLSCLSKEEIDLFIHEKNAQAFFDRYVNFTYYKNQTIKSTSYTRFFHDFSKTVVDVTQVDFDTKQGYGTMEQEKVHLFLYQLEKLNDLVPELSQWLGVPFTKLENSNISNDKWIASHYAHAKENLVLSQDYVDAAYGDDYVKHFYSPEQIATMKAKWQKNIK